MLFRSLSSKGMNRFWPLAALTSASCLRALACANGLGDGGVPTQHLPGPILRTRVIRFLYGEANVSSIRSVRLYVASCSEGLLMAALEGETAAALSALKACNLPVALRCRLLERPTRCSDLKTQLTGLWRPKVMRSFGRYGCFQPVPR